MMQVVQRPPIFTVTPQRLYMRKLGETLEIPCDARDGDQSQRPAIVWFKVSINLLKIVIFIFLFIGIKNP